MSFYFQKEIFRLDTLRILQHSVCLCVCKCRCPWMSDPLGAGITGTYELPYFGAGKQMHPL